MRQRSSDTDDEPPMQPAVAPLAPLSPAKRVPWRKVLWARQPYDDTHTAESFLEELVVNATVPQRDYATVVWSALVVDQQVATVTAVGGASHALYTGRVMPRQLLLADALLMLLGSLLWLASSAWAGAKAASAAGAAAAGAATAAELAALSPDASPPKHRHQHRRRHRRHVQQQQRDATPPSWRASALDGVGSMAALALATALLSPLLGTLTENVSSDTTIACACLLLLAHLYLHDYHFTAALTAQLSASLALGCAVCGSVLVASRLGSPAAVYAQLLLSLELYIVGPYCRRQVAAASHAAHAALTAGMIGAAAALLARQSALATSAYCCALLFITFICPMWLVRIHKFKAAINGPWDEAVPRLSAAVSRQLSQR
ncbi:phosphatidylinositolN-acetylglucosaminyltran sfe ra sesubunit c [Micractinium conductrix]|uniref:PhosphatidylinositolN-acetylglucosaminyltran sfe ra sesubunit c n=1 Tax=Micractinium conductrix TaxID=554055 RepID=A0A2P6VPB9_9CHLO|nr:phosphatidylinositolN-acetylglucosaminyltran sfe ra sesubunit c [Micractinium conductrix]|eukprot:PSC75905.1 phosphatidylinositolN-acetylglucosaminyltran sfe ra sesubunit c [Micractinium conductrix]